MAALASGELLCQTALRLARCINVYIFPFLNRLDVLTLAANAKTLVLLLLVLPAVTTSTYFRIFPIQTA